MDERATEDTPYIERPDEHKVADELYCWMPGNGDRECNGSCVAYDGSYTSDQVRDSCKVLNAVRSIALSFGKQVNITQQQERRAEVAARQEQVNKLPQPPKV